MPPAMPPPEVEEPPPIAVYVAQWDYAGGYREDGELLFKAGQRVISMQEDADWVYGYVEDDTNKSCGWFPKNYVAVSE